MRIEILINYLILLLIMYVGVDGNWLHEICWYIFDVMNVNYIYNVDVHKFIYIYILYN